jgi:hypothetical protein
MTELTEHDPRDVTGGAGAGESVDLKDGEPGLEGYIPEPKHPLSPETLGPAVRSDGALWRGQPPAGWRTIASNGRAVPLPYRGRGR